MSRDPAPTTARGTAALILAVLGLPFLWALAGRVWPGLGADLLPPMFHGRYLALGWGSAVVIFGAGALFGMAARGPQDGAPIPGQGVLLLLAAIPALWTFVVVTDATDISLIYLIAAQAGLALIEVMFARLGLAPAGWIVHRLALTLLACATLAAFLI